MSTGRHNYTSAKQTNEQKRVRDANGHKEMQNDDEIFTNGRKMATKRYKTLKTSHVICVILSLFQSGSHAPM